MRQSRGVACAWYVATECGAPLADSLRDLATSFRFGLGTAEAMTILAEVYEAVANWRPVGRRLHLKAATLEAYSTAFEHPMMDEARRLLS